MKPTLPAGADAESWKATTYCGLGKRVKSPSFSIATAPAFTSSAGCPIMTRVPDQRSFIAAIRRAVPIQADMCVSCPQACITGVSCPSMPTAFTLLAKGRPVCSATGSASMSARSITTGPGPLRIMATTPCPPTPVVTSNPAFFASEAMIPADRFSSPDSSGLAWRSR